MKIKDVSFYNALARVWFRNDMNDVVEEPILNDFTCVAEMRCSSLFELYACTQNCELFTWQNNQHAKQRFEMGVLEKTNRSSMVGDLFQIDETYFMISDVGFEIVSVKKRFYIYWLDGEKTECTGITERDAFTNAGYGAGAISAVDFFSTKDNYVWDHDNKGWVKKEREDNNG